MMTSKSSMPLLQPLHMLVVLMLLQISRAFVLKELCLSESEVASIRNGDKHTGKVLVAKAIREYYKVNTKLTLQRGAVQKTMTLPNQGIHTGHSCSKTAEAMNGRAIAAMVPSQAVLDKLDFPPQGSLNIAEGLFRTRVNLNADVRVTFGSKIFRRCRRVGRKTCSSSATNEGNNRVWLVMAAPEMSIQRTSPEGPEFLVFKPVVKVFGQTVPNSWSGLNVNTGSCRALGINISSYIRRYSSGFFNSLNQVVELRSTAIINQLERQLQMKMSQEVWLPICRK